VVDDSSTDDTEQIVKEYIDKDKRFAYLNRPNNRQKGANACRNFGFEQSKGTYINWFDSDDIMHPDKLKIQVQALEKSDEPFSVCQTLVFEEDVKNVIGLRHPKIYSESVFEDYIKDAIKWLTQAPLWKRNFLEQLDYLFDEELQSSQEWEFHVRVLSQQKSYHYTNDALVSIRKHQMSLSYNNDEKRRSWNYFLSRYKIYNSKKIPLNAEIKELLRTFIYNQYLVFLSLATFTFLLFVYFKVIIRDQKFGFVTKFKLFFGILLQTIFGRGYLFSKRILFKEIYVNE